MSDERSKPTDHLVDPELLQALDAVRDIVVNEAMLPIIRDNFGRGIPEITDAEMVGTEMSRRYIPARSGDPDVGVAVIRPTGGPASRGALLHLHGGGFIVGNPYAFEATLRMWSKQLNCCIVSVDYRLAPETPFPGAIEDGYAALAWMFKGADALGIDPANVGLVGESAGGGLAASLALLARDRGEYSIAFQHLVYPMLDDRSFSSADRNRYAGEYVWTRESNRFGWKSLLGVEPGSPGVSPYAAAARAEDLSGLPATFISTGALDLFVDENIEYAHRLVRAGVPTELHVYAGAYHGFDLLVPTAAVSAKAARDRIDALQRALG